jgi:hypothetical protein
MKSLVIATLAGAAALFSVVTTNVGVAQAEGYYESSCLRTICRGYGYDRSCWKVNVCRRSYH